MDTRKGPLSGFRVLELGNLIAAPYAGRLFAEFGADVIKVERPGTGDELRRWRLFRGSTSLFWSLQARNKKSITLDLRTPEGQEIVLKLRQIGHIPWHRHCWLSTSLAYLPR
jgi:formyl-CoA transferase